MNSVRLQKKLVYYYDGTTPDDRPGLGTGHTGRDASQLGRVAPRRASRKRGPCKCVDATDIIDGLCGSLRPLRGFPNRTPTSHLCCSACHLPSLRNRLGYAPTCTRPRTKLLPLCSPLYPDRGGRRRDGDGLARLAGRPPHRPPSTPSQPITTVRSCSVAIRPSNNARRGRHLAPTTARGSVVHASAPCRRSREEEAGCCGPARAGKGKRGLMGRDATRRTLSLSPRDDVDD